MTTPPVTSVTDVDIRLGAIAGVVSVTVFTVLHHVFINPIWWMFPVMAVAGAICGLCLAWCYGSLTRSKTRASWLIFVGMFTAMFGLLALVSDVIYEPIITMAEVVNSTGGNPIPISETLGLMIGFTIGWAGLMTVLYRRGWRGFGVAVVATSVLMLLLGINVATMGLVEIPTEGWVLVLEFFGYLVALGGIYALSYLLLASNRRRGERLAS